MGYTLGQRLREHLYELVVEHVALGDGEYPLLVEHLGVECSKLVEQNLVFLLDVVGIGRNHEEQQRVALDVAQEAQTKSLSLTCAFNDAGDVSHDERLSVAVRHDAEVRLECGERIVGDFGLSGRNRRKECRLARIGEAYKAYIGKQFQLQCNGHFAHGFTGLCKAGGLSCGCGEVHVAKTSAAAFQQYHLLPVLHYIAEEFACLGVVSDSSAGHINNLVLSCSSGALVYAAALTVASEYVALVLQVEQCPVVAVAAKDDVSSTTAVAASSTATARARNSLVGFIVLVIYLFSYV